MKDLALYDLENKQYCPEGELEISHEDWAFYWELDGFIPLTYKVRMTLSIRQWHQYPSILPRELYLDDQQEGEKFETL